LNGIFFINDKLSHMNSLQRCRAVLNGELPDRVPVIPQSFMYAVEQAGYAISRFSAMGAAWPSAI
jgi:uroporphyrinogen decarboxylase